MNEVFPKRLRELRKKDRKSCKVLSELCGLTPGAIGKYERGEVMPTVESLEAIADYFGVTTDYLLGRKNF